MKTGLIRTSAATAGLAIAITIAVAGCGATTLGIGEDLPGDGAIASDAPSPIQVESPTPAIDLSCAQVADDLHLAERFDSTLVAGTVPNPGEQSALGSLTSFAVRQMGGLACLWDAPGGSSEIDPGVRVFIAPASAAQWDEFAAQAGIEGDRATSCVSDIGSCSADVRTANDWWIAVALSGMARSDDSAQFDADVEATLTALATRVEAAGETGATFTAPEDTVALAESCAEFIPSRMLQQAFTLASPATALPYPSILTIGDAAIDSLGVGTCSLNSDDVVGGLGFVEVLPAGAWAANELYPRLATPTGAESLSIVSLSDGDAAFAFCSENGATNASCVTEIIVGRNWIRLSTSALGQTLTESKASALALATSIVDAVHGG
jgi:hypothetical protein